MPRFPLLEDVLRIHDRQVEVFGGSTGVRDMGLLKSALAQPQATFGGELLHPTLPEQAAAYLYHIAKNHPFVDGNKRTAFAVMDMFIRANGFRLRLSPEQTYEMVLQVAQGDLSKEALALLLSESIVPQDAK